MEKYIVGNKLFETKKEITDYCKKLFSKNSYYGSFKGSDNIFLKDLFSHHPKKNDYNFSDIGMCRGKLCAKSSWENYRGHREDKEISYSVCIKNLKKTIFTEKALDIRKQILETLSVERTYINTPKEKVFEDTDEKNFEYLSKFGFEKSKVTHLSGTIMYGYINEDGFSVTLKGESIHYNSGNADDIYFPIDSDVDIPVCVIDNKHSEYQLINCYNSFKENPLTLVICAFQNNIVDFFDKLNHNYERLLDYPEYRLNEYGHKLVYAISDQVSPCMYGGYYNKSLEVFGLPIINKLYSHSYISDNTCTMRVSNWKVDDFAYPSIRAVGSVTENTTRGCHVGISLYTKSKIDPKRGNYSYHDPEIKVVKIPKPVETDRKEREDWNRKRSAKWETESREKRKREEHIAASITAAYSSRPVPVFADRNWQDKGYGS